MLRVSQLKYIFSEGISILWQPSWNEPETPSGRNNTVTGLSERRVPRDRIITNHQGGSDIQGP